MAREAAELLLRSVRSGKQPRPDLLLLSPELVVRSSSAPAPIC
jgi:DNA-binding LacI/PurR family transcriptional regulator